ncbi:hypothetical protein [Rhizobium sp. SRDI969]|uniref:hypothetical protein n=1 Tax=Rhizobium sp. SRDI969 TaxID=3138252 RepID=UPI0021A61CC7|nr:hypothetical protein [Rhizobium leguminosarum]UWM84951.1 hypothetical protein N2A41_29625 [Rhizobium leguminosarum bv. viciae]
MPDALHFPRLPLRGVRILLQQQGNLATMSWEERRLEVSSLIGYPATGGRRVTDEELRKIRDRIVELAGESGFPDKGSTTDRTNFDKRVAIALIEEDLVPGPDALRDDVWGFLASVLLADVVKWRWETTAVRYQGGVRNALQRLWLRGVSFRRDEEAGRWDLVNALNEDANLSILERPGLSASRVVTRAIGEMWFELSRQKPPLPMEDITRRISRTLRITNQIIPLHALDDASLEAEVRAHFMRAIGTV